MLQYSAFVTPQQREKMICDHLPLVRHIARRTHLNTSGAVLDFEDLVAYGTIGLIQAIDRFDESHGVPFGPYAAPRIRGAILDAFRGLDHLSRGQRTRATRITTSQNSLSLSLGREPTESELLNDTGLSRSLFTAARTAAALTCVPIGQSFDGLDAFKELEVVDTTEPPTAPIERRELLSALRLAIDALPAREQVVVSLLYVELLTQKEAACVLDVSASRIAQLRQQALRRLRRNANLAAVALPIAA